MIDHNHKHEEKIIFNHVWFPRRSGASYHTFKIKIIL